MNATNITNILNYIAAFLGAVVAALVGFDWTTIVSAAVALKIVGALNLVGILAKAWVVTAQKMAQGITQAST